MKSKSWTTPNITRNEWYHRILLQNSGPFSEFTTVGSLARSFCAWITGSLPPTRSTSSCDSCTKRLWLLEPRSQRVLLSMHQWSGSRRMRVGLKVHIVWEIQKKHTHCQNFVLLPILPMMGNGHQPINEDLPFRKDFHCGMDDHITLIHINPHVWDHGTEVFPPCRLLMCVQPEGAWLQDALFVFIWS